MPSVLNKTPYICECCDFTCAKLSNYNTHLLTKKHLIKTGVINIEEKKTEIESNRMFICKHCNLTYLYHSGLSRHMKKCPSNTSCNNNYNITCLTEIPQILEQPNMVIELIKQNQEFKDLLSDQNKIIMKLAEKQGNNITNNIMNNSNNKTFNLQFFLNETCKDAMNIKDFVDTLQISLEDLEKVGSEGFVEGISSIFINALKKLDIHKRPIHCSDLKRETVYLKDEDIWKKDNDKKEHLKKIVELIAYKNQSKIFEWKAAHPDYKDSDSKTNDWYLQIVIQCSGGKNDAEDERLYDKIVKNITKEVTINKK